MEKQQSVSGYKVDTFKMKGSGLVASDTHNLLKTNGAKGGTRTPTGVTPPDPKSGASAKFRHFRLLRSMRFPF